MTSQINAGLIDGSFPTQGVDQPSQGFRTNFTNTAVNFQYAAAEISDLQNKAILKTALTGQTLDNNLDGSPLTGAVINDFAAQVVTLGSQTGTITINYGAGHYQTVTTSGPLNLALTGWPAAGAQGWVTVAVTITNTSHTLTLPSTVSIGVAGITGAVGNVIHFASTGVYSFTFTSSDGGLTVTVNDTNTLLREFNSSSENLISGSAASLSVCSSYFSTTGASTATLAAGVEGQVKTFAMYSAAGAMVITVAAAGWKSGATGTATLTAVGSTATLKVINGRWFVIAAQGATFA